MTLESAILVVRQTARQVDLPAKRTDGQEQTAATFLVVGAACVDAEQILQQLGRQPARLPLAPRMHAPLPAAHGKYPVGDPLPLPGRRAPQQEIDALEGYASAGIDVDDLAAR